MMVWIDNGIVVDLFLVNDRALLGLIGNIIPNSVLFLVHEIVTCSFDLLSFMG